MQSSGIASCGTLNQSSKLFTKTIWHKYGNWPLTFMSCVSEHNSERRSTLIRLTTSI